MISTKLNKTLPISNIGPNWPGVRVLVTEACIQPDQATLTPYGFNLGVHVGDVLHDVQARRTALQDHLGAPIVWLNQVHGCDVIEVSTPTSKSFAGQVAPNADSLVSKRNDCALAIMTADCLPVVFAAFDDSGAPLGVAAAHAGWRGLHLGVLQATVNSLRNACMLPAAQIKAWMGPAIGPASFEVGQDVFDAFVQQTPLNLAAFKQSDKSGKYFADIYSLARTALAEIGVLEIQSCGLDTFTDSRWFSHRRGLQQGVPSGRFATLVQLLPKQGA